MIELPWYIQDINLRQAFVAAVVIFLVLNVTVIVLAFVYEVARLLPRDRRRGRPRRDRARRCAGAAQ